MIRTMLIAMLVVVPFTQAVSKTPDAKTKKVSAEQRQEFWSWYQSTVYPSLKKWHDEFDASLSSTDLATLNTLRSQARQHKQSLRAKAMELKSNGTAKADRKEAIAQLKSQSKQAKQTIAEQLRPIMQRNKEKLTAILTTNQSTIQQWQTEARAKFTKLPKDAPLLNNDGKKAAVRFVLWNGTMPTPLSNNRIAPAPTDK